MLLNVYNTQDSPSQPGSMCLQMSIALAVTMNATPLTGKGPHFVGKETGAQRSYLTFPKSHSL